MAGKRSPRLTPLSERELEILELVASGLTNLQIADTLEISKRTVDNHVSNILTKTATDNRVALVRWALQWGKVCLENVNCCALPLSNLEPCNDEVSSHSDQSSSSSLRGFNNPRRGL